VLWINAEVADSARTARLRAAGWNITTWTRQVNFADPRDLAYELATIESRFALSTSTRLLSDANTKFFIGRR
jgi:hypothetical protein